VFPALFRPPKRGRPGQAAIDAGEAACFYHPNKQAVVICDRCGRLLCTLCYLDIQGRHFCSNCLAEIEQEGQAAHRFVRSSTRWDSLALMLATLPLLLFFVTIITAPIALFLVVKYWNRRCSAVESHRWRLVLAGLFALAEIAGWTLFGLNLFTR